MIGFNWPRAQLDRRFDGGRRAVRLHWSQTTEQAGVHFAFDRPIDAEHAHAQA
jgi:hypothetical protein